MGARGSQWGPGPYPLNGWLAHALSMGARPIPSHPPPPPSLPRVALAAASSTPAGAANGAGGDAPPAPTLAAAFRAQSLELWGAVRQPGILAPAAFTFLWQVGGRC
jgi:hypothetical protein